MLSLFNLVILVVFVLWNACSCLLPMFLLGICFIVCGSLFYMLGTFLWNIVLWISFISPWVILLFLGEIKILFTYLRAVRRKKVLGGRKERRRGRERGRKGERKREKERKGTWTWTWSNSHFLVHSWNAHKGWGWAEAETGSWELFASLGRDAITWAITTASQSLC